MRRYFIQLAYNGSNYHGWQIQPNAISVQEKVEEAMTTYFGRTINIIAAGRTDTGVHAKKMFVHFDWGDHIESKVLTYKLNAILPKDIVIEDVIEVNKSAHARFDALERTYEYRLSTKDSPFYLNLQYRHFAALDFDKMNQAAQLLLGEKDFSCFSKSKTQTYTNICVIKEAKWIQIEDGLYQFNITANRFLRNMVRAIVGTLIAIGEGKKSVEYIEELIKSKDRSNAGSSVPAHGLYLTDIIYPQEIWK